MDDTLYRDLRILYPKMLQCEIECDEGWDGLITEMIHALGTLDPQPKIAQIKEKFGGLRCYHNLINEQARDIVQMAEDRSERTCEMCGEPGEIKNLKGWWKCVCPTHASV